MIITFAFLHVLVALSMAGTMLVIAYMAAKYLIGK